MSVTMSQQDIDALRNAKRLGEQTLSDLDKAERAGIDVKQHRIDVEASLKQINQILSVYG